ncbi:MAG: dipeptidase [Luteimonas sp.]
MGRFVVNGLDTSDLTTEFLGFLRQGKVDCTHKSILDGPYSFGPILRFLDEQAAQITMARTAAEIRQAKRDGKIALVCGAQSADYMLPLFEPFHSRMTQIGDALRVNYRLGLRTQGIAYNLANIFGGGCLEPQSPLTRVGRRLVEEVHKQHILLDVGGHTGEQTSLDALAMSAGVPVVCSHTNLAALNPNPRATSDRVLEAIAKTGGVIGVTAISDFHVRNSTNIKQGPRSPHATLDTHLDQYDYLKRLVGIDHIALGTDHFWGWGNVEVHSATEHMRFPPEAMSDGPPRVVQGFENISKLPDVERGLAARGWTQDELDKLMGANWLRVYRAAWGA